MSETEAPPVWPEYKVPLDPFFAWTPIDRNAPIAYARLKRVKAGGVVINQWEVIRCPYCGRSHTHGAGERTDDPRAFLGGRVAHCEATIECDEYRLVEWDGQKLPIKTLVSVGRIPLSREIRADVWDKTRGKCWYCGVEMHPFRNYHVDHFIPVIDGGTNDISNLVPSCQSCNSRKHARPAEYLRRFIASGKFYGEGIE